MRAIWITRHGGPDVLEVREQPDPEPGPGEVRIRVRASGLNFAELMARQGLYPDAPKPPCVVGYEVSGVIDAMGPGQGSTALGVGSRVLAMMRFGGHADVVCVPVTQMHAIPDHASFEEAAALPVVYLTAFHILFRVASLKPDARVLVHMAGGGVGLAVLDLVRTVPRVVVLGTASESKHALLRERGFDHCIDYRTADYVAEVRRLTDGRGVDLVLDPLGGDDWRKGYELLRPGGMLVAYGFANMAGGETRNLFRVVANYFKVPKFSPMGLMDQNRGVAGVNMGHLWSEVELLNGEIRELLTLFGEKRIRPTVDSVFKFDQAAAAHRRMHERKNVGKVILVP